MRHEDIPIDLRLLTFEFFFWFSRFGFALKENGYPKDELVGAKAAPNWQRFVRDFQEGYTLTPAANELIAANPKSQVVGRNGLEFRDIGFDDRPSDLGKVVRLAQTVRNNLFHGGKHGNNAWDDPNRMRQLLPLVITILVDIAEPVEIEADYRRYY